MLSLRMGISGGFLATAALLALSTATQGAGKDVRLDTPAQRLAALKSSDPATRRKAIESLRTVVHDEATFRAILDALDDPDAEVRRITEDVLQTRADVDIFDFPAAPRWIKEGPRASRAIPKLLQRLSDPDASVRQGAVGALLACGPKAVPGLVNVFEDRKGPLAVERRVNAINVLAAMVTDPNPKIHAAIRQALVDKMPAVRKRAVEVLCCGAAVHAHWRGSVRHYGKQLARLLKDPDPEVAWTAQTCFSGLKEAGGDGVAWFVESLKDPKKQATAIRALGEIGQSHPGLLPALLPLLEVHEGAAETLGRCCGKGQEKVVVPALVRLLAPSKAEGLRISAARGLEALGPRAKSAAHALAQVVRDEVCSDVAQKAFAALKRIDPPTAKQVDPKKQVPRPLPNPVPPPRRT